jgi:bifunctional non-homologous end joining protein LigD
LRYSDHIEGRGQQVFRRSCEYALEGTVSKRRDSPYRSGRGTDWVKVKCQKRQEFVVGGFTDPRGSRQGLGSLLLGVHEQSRLIYAGKVGTGFSESLLRELRATLGALSRPDSPFDSPVPRAESRGAHWVEPRLVAEVSFSNWTRDHRLRHPSFLGLREDKPAARVVREAPAVRLTHPERVLYPDAGITKADLARYYEEIAPRLLPHIEGRLLALVRCPDGVGGPCFYQKRPPEGAPPSIQRAEGGVFLDDKAGLVALAQLGVLEIHPWGSRLEDLELPDRCTFDLDPGPGVRWADVVRAARDVRDWLRDLGLESFVKTTGGKGLHVVLPLERGPTWGELKAFAARVAWELAARHPDRYTASLSKSARAGRIFIDYLRNGRGATAVAPYSPRARAGAPVSVPLAWKDLTPALDPGRFTVPSLPGTLKRSRKDPWARFFRVRQRLPLISGVRRAASARPYRSRSAGTRR